MIEDVPAKLKAHVSAAGDGKLNKFLLKLQSANGAVRSRNVHSLPNAADVKRRRGRRKKISAISKFN
ncbi:hypothetical protein DVH05_014415 [Phytophthora capsici]|nr:hypothetical protein DVH05_014415 [Phytophthora capsici]